MVISVWLQPKAVFRNIFLLQKNYTEWIFHSNNTNYISSNRYKSSSLGAAFYSDPLYTTFCWLVFINIVTDENTVIEALTFSRLESGLEVRFDKVLKLHIRSPRKVCCSSRTGSWLLFTSGEDLCNGTHVAVNPSQLRRSFSAFHWKFTNGDIISNSLTNKA